MAHRLFSFASLFMLLFPLLSSLFVVGSPIPISLTKAAPLPVTSIDSSPASVPLAASVLAVANDKNHGLNGIDMVRQMKPIGVQKAVSKSPGKSILQRLFEAFQNVASVTTSGGWEWVRQGATGILDWLSKAFGSLRGVVIVGDNEKEASTGPARAGPPFPVFPPPQPPSIRHPFIVIENSNVGEINQEIEGRISQTELQGTGDSSSDDLDLSPRFLLDSRSTRENIDPSPSYDLHLLDDDKKTAAALKAGRQELEDYLSLLEWCKYGVKESRKRKESEMEVEQGEADGGYNKTEEMKMERPLPKGHLYQRSWNPERTWPLTGMSDGSCHSCMPIMPSCGETCT